MDRTESTLRELHKALDSDGYDIGVLDSRGMYPRLEALPFSRVLRLIPYLKFRNLNGAHIHFRPGGESRLSLLDDLTADGLARLQPQGYAPCAVVETSPGNYQAWLKHASSLPKELDTFAAKMLAKRFNADTGAADWRRFGRLPGYTNRKPQHLNAAGLYPFARLIRHEGQTFQNVVVNDDAALSRSRSIADPAAIAVPLQHRFAQTAEVFLVLTPQGVAGRAHAERKHRLAAAAAVHREFNGLPLRLHF